MFKAIATGLTAAARGVPSFLIDVAGLAGVGLISYGAWRIYEPAGFIVGGLLVLAGAIILGAKSAKRST